MKFKQHIPAFIDGIESKTFDFNSVDELLNNDHVKSFSDDPNFIRFSVSGELLMAEYTNRWWVVGYLSDPIDLPVWKKPEDKQ